MSHICLFLFERFYEWGSVGSKYHVGSIGLILFVLSATFCSLLNLNIFSILVKNICIVNYLRSVGCRNSSLRKIREHPASIDESVNKEEGSSPLFEFIQDPNAEAAFERIDTETIIDTILSEVDNLEDSFKRRIIRECDYGNKLKQSLADELGMSKQTLDKLRNDAIAQIRRVPVVRDLGKEFFKDRNRELREARCSPFRNVGVKSFRSSFTSSVEAIILSREMYDEKKHADTGV